MISRKAPVFKYGGVDLSDVLDVNPTRGLGLPAEDYTRTVPGKSGQLFLRRRLEPLEIPLKVRLKLRDLPPYDLALERRRVVAALMSDEPKPLVIPDEPTRYYLAILTDPGELDTLWKNGGTTLTFTAYDPVAYGERRRRMVALGATQVLVKGSANTRPTFTLTAEGGKVRVTYGANGQYVALLDSVSKGAAVVIDMEGQGTTVDGQPVPIELGSDYFEVSPGIQTVTVDGAHGTVEWDERWV